MSRRIRQQNGLDIPPKISVEVSAACTRRCPWCPQHDHTRMQELMPLEVIEKIARELAAVGFDGTFGLHLFNEPLADARLEDIVRRVKAILPKAAVYFHTNGDLLTVERVRGLLAAGLDHMTVNHYDGQSQERFSALWGQLSDDERARVRDRKFRHHHIYNRAGLVATKRQVPLQMQCRRIRQMCVNYRGDVVLCCNDFLGQVSVGNVRDKGVVELFNDPVLKRYRELLQGGKRAGLKMCDRCDLFG